jgi:BirA family biotin operon repressor/biotin-[acetyl-CoA-carboxylase] ligase
MPTIIRLKEIDSTNRYLQDLIKEKELKEGSLVVAEKQTAGKGQMGNKWEAEAGKNITCSLVLYPHFVEIVEQFILSELISLALKDTLSALTDDICIKWPNDIYYKDKKMAGILIENTLYGDKIDTCIVGIGLNVNQEIFTSNAPNPISLKQITNQSYKLDDILINLHQNIFNRYAQLLKGENEKLHQEYQDALFRKEGYHHYKANGEIFEAKIKRIEKTGHLVLETKNQEERHFAFKEVQIVL